VTRTARRSVSLAAALAALVCAAEAAAQQTEIVGLPYALSLLPPSPPFATTTLVQGEQELRLPGHASMSQRISVDVAPDGRPRRVHAAHRIRLTGLGDYVFAVPAPVEDIVPGPGSESQPGLRSEQIVWQGFSPRRKLLAAVATLRPRAAARLLPARLTLSTRVGGKELEPGRRRSGRLDLTLELRNTTLARVTTYKAAAEPISAARALDALRDAETRGVPTPSRVVALVGRVLPKTESVTAPFRVAGAIRFPAGSVSITTASGAVVRGSVARFGGVFGGEQPSALQVSLTGTARQAGPPVVSVVVTPLTRDPAVQPPASSWVEAVRRRRTRLSGRALLARAIALDLSYTRARQYDTFLRPPDPTTRNRTTYVFRVVAARPVAVAPAAEPASGGGVLLPILLGLGGAVALVGAVVAWAHL
jgi:hypothetical protein